MFLDLVRLFINMNKTEHAVQSYAAGKTSKIALPMVNNANAKQC